MSVRQSRWASAAPRHRDEDAAAASAATVIRCVGPGEFEIARQHTGGARWIGQRSCFGFAPLQLPPELDFTALFHGIDEHVPVDSLEFGVRVLDRFLRSA